MPKKTNRSVVKSLVAIMAFAGVVAVGFILYMWWQVRQLEMVQYREFGIPIPADYTIHGIDVSHYQQLISWEAVQEM